MIEKRPFASLGHARHGWLNARHHFSFANYYDPQRMGWGPIRVWNDDEIAPQSGFAPHPHRDMEIITYVRQGAITHQDSLGNKGRTEAGDVQVMSAGSGITHSEYNLEDEETRLFQIWIHPRETGGAPRWDAKSFPRGDRAGTLEVLASGDEADIAAGALMIRSDARLLGATLEAEQEIVHSPIAGGHVYLVAAKGRLVVNGVEIGERDALAIKAEATITIRALEDSEVVLAETRPN